MENIEYQEEEQIISQNSKLQQKNKKFKQYLVSSGTVQHFVKFLFGLRTKQQTEETTQDTDALQMFSHYFGALTPDTTEQNQIKEEINKIKAENSQFLNQILEIKSSIQARHTQIQKLKEQKRLREQQQAKNPKKGGKK